MCGNANNPLSPEQCRSFILYRRPDNLGQSVGGVHTVTVRPVPPEERVLAGGEHDGPQPVPQDEGAGAVVEDKEGVVTGGEARDDGVEMIPNPSHLHHQPLLQNVFDNGGGGEVCGVKLY